MLLANKNNNKSSRIRKQKKQQQTIQETYEPKSGNRQKWLAIEGSRRSSSLTLSFYYCRFDSTLFLPVMLDKIYSALWVFCAIVWKRLSAPPFMYRRQIELNPLFGSDYSQRIQAHTPNAITPTTMTTTTSSIQFEIASVLFYNVQYKHTCALTNFTNEAK